MDDAYIIVKLEGEIFGGVIHFETPYGDEYDGEECVDLWKTFCDNPQNLLHLYNSMPHGLAFQPSTEKFFPAESI